MKNLLISANQAQSFGLNMFKADDIANKDERFFCELSTWNDELTLFKSGIGYTPSDSEAPVQATFQGKIYKMKRVSDKCLVFSLRVYDGKAEGKALWINCACAGSTATFVERFSEKTDAVVTGSFTVEEHETFGRTLKLFVNKLSPIFSSNSNNEDTSTKSTEAVASEDIPF